MSYLFYLLSFLSIYFIIIVIKFFESNNIRKIVAELATIELNNYICLSIVLLLILFLNYKIIQFSR